MLCIDVSMIVRDCADCVFHEINHIPVSSCWYISHASSSINGLSLGLMEHFCQYFNYLPSPPHHNRMIFVSECLQAGVYLCVSC